MNNIITDIVPSQEDPNLRSIFVGDECVAVLSGNTLELLKIEIGGSWDKQITQDVATHESECHARSIAIDLISRRMWGSKELETRLIQRGIEMERASTTIASLVNDEWLDDLLFARSLIVELTRKEPASKLWLSKKLRDKKIGEEIAKTAISEAFENICQQDAATAFALGRLSKLTEADKEKRQHKVLGALQRRGFTSEESHEAFRRAISESSS